MTISIVSTNKHAIASSQNSSYVATNITDGDINSRWYSSDTDPTPYIIIDMGYIFDLSYSITEWHTNKPISFTVLGSKNGTNYETIKSIYDTNTALNDDTININKPFRFIKLQANDVGPENSYGFIGIKDFKIYGQPAEYFPKDDLTSGVKTLNSDSPGLQLDPVEYNEQSTTSNLVSTTGWVYLNMQKDTYVSYLEIGWNGGNYAKEYTVQLANSPYIWDTIPILTTIHKNTTGVDRIDIHSIARYIKIDVNGTLDINSIDSGTKIVATGAKAGDNSGRSLAVSGNTIVVGAIFEDTGGSNAGAAYIYRKTGTTWDSGTKILATGAGANDYFGWSVAVSGDVIVVGAPNEDTGLSNVGAAYIYRWNGSAWDSGTKIVATGAKAGDQFGYSVSVSGDVVVVGAYGEDTGGSNAGAAYIYRWNGTIWDSGTKIVATDPGANDRFGVSVSVSGDVVVVGAPYEDTDGTIDTGAAYIYRWNGGAWDSGTKIVATGAKAGDYFGYSVSVSGDVVVVGAILEDTWGASAGAAYIYRWNGSAWDSGTKIVATDPGANDQFGNSVSVSGDVIVVGARFEDADGIINTGAAYVYIWNGSAWDTGTKIVASDAGTGDRFGESVSVSGDVIVVGAPYEDKGNTLDTGAAYIYNMITPIDTYDIQYMNVYGKKQTVPVEIQPITDTDFVSVTKTFNKGKKILNVSDTVLLDYIYQNNNVFTSVYPYEEGTTYNLNIKTLTTTATGVYIELKENLPLDIDISILLSKERRLAHVSLPPSIRSTELEYLHDISYMNLDENQNHVIEPVVNSKDIRVGFVDKNTLLINVHGTPWTSNIPIHINIYNEPRIFGTIFDKRSDVNNGSKYILDQTFEKEIFYKNPQFITKIHNYVPVFTTVVSMNVPTTPTQVVIPTEDGDMVAMDSSNQNVIFASYTVGTRFEPYVSATTAQTGVNISVSVYRRVQNENSIPLKNYVHDYSFVNKQYTPITGQPNRNLNIYEENDKTVIELYGKINGTVEFEPVSWKDTIPTPVTSAITTSELTPIFEQDINLLSEKGINITSASNISMDKLNITANKTILGAGVLVEFSLDTNTLEISSFTEIPTDTSVGVYTVEFGSLTFGNYITFDFEITAEYTLNILNETLSITGFPNTTVDMEKLVPSILPIKNININKFIGLSGSSITINSAADEIVSTNESMNVNNVNIESLSKVNKLHTNNIKTLSFMENKNLEISKDAININTPNNTKLGSLVVFTDELKVSMDSKYTLIDSDKNDVIVSKQVVIEPTGNLITISKIENSVLPSNISINNVSNVKNIYKYLSSGKVKKLGALTSTVLPNETTLLFAFDGSETSQTYLDKIYTSSYKISDFGSNLPYVSEVITGASITITYKSGIKTLVEKYALTINSGFLNTGETRVGTTNNVYKKSNPLTSLETHTYTETISTFDKITNTRTHSKYTQDRYLYEKATFTITTTAINMTIVKRNKATVNMINTQIGEFITPTTTDGELEIRGNEPQMKTANISQTIYENNKFQETSSSVSGLKTIHGTYIDTTASSINTNFTRNKIESVYQDPETYDASLIDTGIVLLTDVATFKFSSNNGIITKSSFPVSEILTGVYEILTKTANSYTLNTISVLTDVYIEVKRTPKIKPHGRHNKYFSPQLSNVSITKTSHTETNLHIPVNKYDIKYIGPVSYLDFYCEGVWYPQMKINSTTYLDTHIKYVSGNPRKRTITNLAANPFDNKQSVETYGLSLLSKETVLALKNSGISTSNEIISELLTERVNPVENMSNLAFIKGKSINTINYTETIKSILAYTTLFDDSTTISTVLNVLATSVPEKTENLRKALFDVSPVNTAFDVYVAKETSDYTIQDNNWSKGLQVVGEKYISNIKKAVLEIKGISVNNLETISSGVSNGTTATFESYFGVNPESDFNTAEVLSLDSILKEVPSKISPGRWIKCGNVVWMSADIEIPVISSLDVQNNYVIGGNPFKNLIRGISQPVIPPLEFSETTHVQVKPSTLVYKSPNMIPDYILDHSDNPFPNDNVSTRVNTDGTIGMYKQNTPMKYSQMSVLRHKFTGTFQIVDIDPDIPYESYIIPTGTDLTPYGYEYDEAGNEIFAGYPLKGSSVVFNKGIYT